MCKLNLTIYIYYLSLQTSKITHTSSNGHIAHTQTVPYTKLTQYDTQQITHINHTTHSTTLHHTHHTLHHAHHTLHHANTPTHTHTVSGTEQVHGRRARVTVFSVFFSRSFLTMHDGALCLSLTPIRYTNSCRPSHVPRPPLPLSLSTSIPPVLFFLSVFFKVLPRLIPYSINSISPFPIPFLHSYNVPSSTFPRRSDKY